MNYHNITYPDMNNGDGLRVVLWLSGCSHHCKNCQNPQTWNPDSGIPFDKNAEKELLKELSKDYISGITFSGGDPLHENNLKGVSDLILLVRKNFPNKTIWLYTGYTWEQIMNPVVTDNFNPERDKVLQTRKQIVEQCDILVDGRYVNELRDITLEWRGSSNQRVISVKKSLRYGQIVMNGIIKE